MSPRAALFIIIAVSTSAYGDYNTSCRKVTGCPCGGQEEQNVTICLDNFSRECIELVEDCEDCNKLYEAGCLESNFSTEQKKSRTKRQYYQGRVQGYPVYGGGCPDVDSPKLGSIRCLTGSLEKTCTGGCLPGYSFEGRETEAEIMLTCRNGVWSPTNRFPPCKSGGHCSLVAQGHGNFNCTTSMDGTWCDVRCSNQYPVRYYCFPGRSWEPALPRCVRPKEVNTPTTPRCRCEYGGTCDRNGNCICPVGRSGPLCEQITPEVHCHDPGQVANADRLNSDGSISRTGQHYEVGQSVVYTCKPGYALHRRSLITCLASGSWSDTLPHCTVIQTPPPPTTPPPTQPLMFCRDPGTDPNGSRSPSSAPDRRGFPPGSQVQFTCKQNYDLKGDTYLFCLVSGKWSAGRPTCEDQAREPAVTDEYCFNPGSIANGKFLYYPQANSRRGLPDKMDDPEFPVGSRLQYSCDSGFTLEGASSLVCQADGDWSGNVPTCKEDLPDLVYCPNPGPISNGERSYFPNLFSRTGANSQANLDDPEYPQGSRFQYSCSSGYSLVGDSVLICEDTGEWTADTPTCRRQSSPNTLRYCDNPGEIDNGQVLHVPALNERRRPQAPATDPQYPAGSSLQYTCNNGYKLEGPSSLTCDPAGFWSEDPPSCIRDSNDEIMYCDNPGPIQDGRVIPTLPRNSPSTESNRDEPIDYPQGTSLRYRCDDGYTLIGTSLLTCHSSGFWSSDPPMCQTECGIARLQTTRRIIHGNRTAIGEWPWIVAIAVRSGDVNQIVCGGALLNSRTVLTAAHCLDEPPFILYFGKYHRRDRNDDNKVVQARSTQIIKHPDFNDTTFDSDVGLIKFSPRIRFSDRIQPICLPSAQITARNLMTGKKGIVTGWGLTERSLPSEELLKAELPVLTNSVCMDSYRRQNLDFPVTQNMYCAGFEDSRQSACSGDSGSPMVFFDKISKRHNLEGLVSFGVQGQCGLPGRYTVFTKVYRFLPWIMRNL